MMRTLNREKVVARREYVPDESLWIALNLFYKRREFGLTQGQLAKKAGVSFRRYQSIETAATGNVTVKTLRSLAQVLGLEVRDLFKPRKDYIRV
jgi:transcriptional regulator with XRE-family HTH domain